MKLAKSAAIALAAGLGLTTVFGNASDASAQAAPAQCGPSEQMHETYEKTGGSITGQGVGSGGKSLTEVMSRPDGMYVMLKTDTKGQTCQVNIGSSWGVVKEQAPLDLTKLPTLSTPQKRAQFQVIMQMRSRGMACNTPEIVFGQLQNDFQEQLHALGKGADGAIYTLFSTPEGAVDKDGKPSANGWTMVMNSGKGGIPISCIIDSGEDWETTAPKPSGIDVQYAIPSR